MLLTNKFSSNGLNNQQFQIYVSDRSYYEDEENSDDYEEYDDEDSKSYSAYKRRLIKELEK